MIDLARLIICIPKIATFYANNTNSEGENIIELVLHHIGQSTDRKMIVNNYRLALFFLTNLLQMNQFFDLLYHFTTTIINFVQDALNYSDDDKIFSAAMNVLLS